MLQLKVLYRFGDVIWVCTSAASYVRNCESSMLRAGGSGTGDDMPLTLSVTGILTYCCSDMSLSTASRSVIIFANLVFGFGVESSD